MDIVFLMEIDCRLPGSDQIVEISITALPSTVFDNNGKIFDSYTYKTIYV